MNAEMNGRRVGFWELVRTAEIPELGPGPRAGVAPLQPFNRSLDQLFSTLGLSAERGPRLRATALLYHDHHDAAHDLVQDMQDADGALIHAILHRREPDYWNAKYWFRRSEDHAIYRAVTKAAVPLAAAPDERRQLEALTLAGTLDPFAFVDACEAVARQPETDPRVRFLRRLQQAEFEALVDHLLVSDGD
jgi:hypothetical protein